MKYLLDTCTFLWILADSRELSLKAREAFQDPHNKIYLSAVSTWEICVKHARGKMSLPDSPAQFIPTMRIAHSIEALSLDEESTLYIDRLPDVHRDPFDRMLVCQAIVHNLIILSPDRQIPRYPVKTDW